MLPPLNCSAFASAVVPVEKRPLLVHHVARLLELSPRRVRHLAARRELKGFKQSDSRRSGASCGPMSRTG